MKKYNRSYAKRSTKRQLKIRKYLGGLLLLAIAFTAYAGWLMEFPEYVSAEVNIAKASAIYEYNEQVPVEVIRAEIITQANTFGISYKCMDKIVFCESGYNNLAKNPKSTALGVAQYVISTWQETQSFIKERKARTDYVASLREMAIDIANGEIWRWNQSKGCWKSECSK